MQFDPIPSHSAFEGENRRSVHRRRLLKAATISPDGLDTVLDCTLRNISEDGARIRVSSQIGIPGAFMLMSEDENINARTRVVWRSETEIGLRFQAT